MFRPLSNTHMCERRYADPIQAETAVSRSLRLQSGQLLLSVQRMTSELAHLLNLNIDTLAALSGSTSGSGSSGGATMKGRDLTAVSMADKYVNLVGDLGGGESGLGGESFCVGSIDIVSNLKN